MPNEERGAMWQATDGSDMPYLTADQMVEVDRAMVRDYRIGLIQMMENAGRNLAHLARMRFLGGDPRGMRTVILAGTGANGGGALVCARRLHNWGAQIRVFVTADESRFAPKPGHQLDILRRMRVSIQRVAGLDDLEGADLVVDGIIGYSLEGAPHGAAAALIDWAIMQEAPILSLDVPSGVDATTGAVFDPAIRATATMTVALPKEGLRAAGVGEYVGELYLADISVPPELYAGPGLGLAVDPIFAEEEIVRLV